MALTTVQQVQAAYLQINRVPLNEASAVAVAAAIDGGTTTFPTYQAGLIAQANTTTTAAFALSTFIEGVVPTSARIDSLTAFAALQHDYYVNVLGSANAQLGAYEALGKAFAADSSTSATFAARYGALSTTDFVSTAYASIFNGSPPSAGALANLVAQVNYFTGIYTAAGIPAADAALQAKGAVLGQIIGYASTTSDPILEAASGFDAQIEALINQAANEARAEITPSSVYGVAGLGINISLLAAANTVAPSGATFTSTQFNDTIKAVLGALPTIDNNTAINGAAGTDTLKLDMDATLADQTYAPAAEKVVSIENFVVKSTEGANDVIVDLTNVTGVQSIALDGTSVDGAGATTFQGIDSTVMVKVGGGGAVPLTVDFADAATKATVELNGAFTGGIEFTDATVKTLNVTTTATANTFALTDAEIETFTVAGKGSATVVVLDAGLKSFDASGVGTFSNVNTGATVFTNNATFKLGDGADTFETNITKAHTITLGAGNDTVELNAAATNNLTGGVGTDALVTKAVLSVADLALTGSSGDTIRFDGVTTDRTVLTQTVLDNAAASANLLAAATVVGAATSAGATDSWAFFEFGTDTYAYYDVANNGLDANDALVKLSGVDLSALSFSGASQNVFLV